MWLEGSDLSLSLEEWMAQALEFQSPDHAYPITRNEKKPRWDKNYIQPYFVGGGHPGLEANSLEANS